jgi:hypothetical protein
VHAEKLTVTMFRKQADRHEKTAIKSEARQSTADPLLNQPSANKGKAGPSRDWETRIHGLPFGYFMSSRRF